MTETECRSRIHNSPIRTIHRPVRSCRDFLSFVDQDCSTIGTGENRTTITFLSAKRRDNRCPIYIHFQPSDSIHSQGEHGIAFCAKIALMIDGVAIHVGLPARDGTTADAQTRKACEAIKWIVDQADWSGFDPMRMMVGGADSGANLAAKVVLASRPNQGHRSKRYRILFHLLISPVLDPAAGSAAFEAIEQASETADLTLHDMPELLIITDRQSGFHPLSTDYAHRLQHSGVRVTNHCFTKSRPEFVLTGQDEWEDAHKMIILNMLFAIRRAA